MHQPALQGLWSSETVRDPALFNLKLIQIVEFVLFNTDSMPFMLAACCNIHDICAKKSLDVRP